MKPLSVSHIKTILDGELIQGSDDVIVHYGAYRLKQIKNRNTIFFSNTMILDWERLKEFLPLVLVTNQRSSQAKNIKNLTVIKVKDAEKAYWKFVEYYRNLFQIPVVAITGTSGKTTTKEMVKHILSADKKVAATIGTNNSRTAHLQYLLSIDDETEAAVFETAVGTPGDVLKASEYFKPTIGIITNIGAHHLNYCKTLEAYIDAKGEMIAALNHSGLLIINADDPNSRKIDLSNFHGKIIKIGKDSACHFRASDIKYRKKGMDFIVRHEQNNYPMFVPGFGEHQVYNALCAVAAAHAIGVSLPKAADRLKKFKKFNKQIQVFEGINGSTLIDDTWSITTTSLEAALKVLNEVGKAKKKVAILGTITDLGSWGYVIHEQAGELIHQNGVDVLVTIGFHARIMAEHAVKSGLNAQVYTFNNSPLAYDLLTKIVDENTIILIKGDMYSKPIIELAFKLRKKK
ncbi:UDP-N-acetylmuramoyl-tripeptide--D-alanyl-D-alanine ligase [Bacillus sp. FJAT-29790]|uniref:Mur ligase family protein n=1 Tax=Bacillus sp. FJAT-29790 TaxID=1895002 RepID=UPI001C229C51|nr:Mur ligase family protein [Bacillus sp. FJAT-29790]MBU8879979.1 UDP-N-acetylmuramoyl-tripeptide--D-alanyl-D-alanine ligase [Bacillus sp. FJAT-29790]